MEWCQNCGCGRLNTPSGSLERVRQNLRCSKILWAYRVAELSNDGVEIDFLTGGGKLSMLFGNEKFLVYFLNIM